MSQPTPPRLIGGVDHGHPGLDLIILGGMHGNEPAGIQAARRVLGEISALGLTVHGRIHALVGNRRASAEGRRFLEVDLNRLWRPAQLAALLSGDPKDDGPEDREQRELLDALAPFIEHPERPAVLIDLHSTSGPGAPFGVGADTLRNRALVGALGITVMLGLEESIEGTLAGFLTDLGHVTIGVEGGQHDDPATVDNLESLLWLTLDYTGIIPGRAQPQLAFHRQRLAAARGDLPQYVEVLHRYGISPEDRFAMRPGFTNFQPVESGEPLADDRRGVIRAPFTGRLLMPLYQSKGEDGFFMGQDVKRSWLWLSHAARRARLDRWLHHLPGIRGYGPTPDQLLVDEDHPKGLLRLLGYRRHAEHAGGRLLSRRRADHLPPIDHRAHPEISAPPSR